MSLELLSYVPEKEVKDVSLLFIHGANHGAWCWKENFLPYFQSKGITSYALSFRGHGKSKGIDGLDNYSLKDYMNDVLEVLEIIKNVDKKPFLVGHSMGGLIAQNILIEKPQLIKGLILMSSVANNGSKSELKRLLCTQFMPFCKFLRFNAKKRKVPPMKLFLSDDSSSSMKERYRDLLQIESNLAYKECFNSHIDINNKHKLPILVLGSYKDKMISWKTTKKLAELYDTEGVFFEGIGHDMMLDKNWKKVADYIIAYLMNLNAQKVAK